MLLRSFNLKDKKKWVKSSPFITVQLATVQQVENLLRRIDALYHIFFKKNCTGVIIISNQNLETGISCTGTKASFNNC